MCTNWNWLLETWTVQSLISLIWVSTLSHQAVCVFKCSKSQRSPCFRRGIGEAPPQCCDLPEDRGEPSERCHPQEGAGRSKWKGMFCWEMVPAAIYLPLVWTSERRERKMATLWGSDIWKLWAAQPLHWFNTDPCITVVFHSHPVSLTEMHCMKRMLAMQTLLAGAWGSDQWNPCAQTSCWALFIATSLDGRMERELETQLFQLFYLKDEETAILRWEGTRQGRREVSRSHKVYPAQDAAHTTTLSLFTNSPFVATFPFVAGPDRESQ